jgi:homogentisate 1,2-dioxygenase
MKLLFPPSEEDIMDTAVTTGLTYQTGFGNEFATEALPGALPQGQNSPQKVAYGLYAELLSGTAFTAPRDDNRRTWFYRIRPSVKHLPFTQIDNGLVRGAPFDEAPATPNQMRWDPQPIPAEDTDFIEGLMTLMGAGDGSMTGLAVHVYAANASMTEKYFYNADGEMLFVPQQGGLTLLTEMGVMEIEPNEVAAVPRGVKHRIELPDGPSRGYVLENYGAAFRLPNLGPIGSNGLANPRDFQSPVAQFEDREGDFRMVAKFGGNLWECEIGHSPLDVVAWHGNLAPYKYRLARFCAVNSVTFDHIDPSIFTVLTSPTDTEGVANADFVIFPPRWVVSENTYRPPWYHRNVMSEFMGLIKGEYDGRKEGFVPGGASLHNSFAAHGNDAEVFGKASEAELTPQFLGGSMAFMFETRHLYRPTSFAYDTPTLQKDYFEIWQGLQKNFNGRA